MDPVTNIVISQNWITDMGAMNGHPVEIWDPWWFPWAARAVVLLWVLFCAWGFAEMVASAAARRMKKGGAK